MPSGRVAYDLTGQKFGKLTALSLAERSKSGNIRWLCQCDCGKMVVVHGSSLRKGSTKSCGCLQKQRCSEVNTRHGGSNSRLYNEWASMKARCNNKNNKRYHRYGGRGIIVCEEWSNNFEAFRDWALSNGYDENAPFGQCTIERIDVNGNYDPANCRWANMKEQQNNKQGNRFITYNGKTQTVKQWAEELGIDYHCLYTRLIEREWPIEKAFTRPTRKKPRKLGTQ